MTGRTRPRWIPLHDEAAVSPVIGVILMVAITVILAAVIGTFALGFGDEQSNAPSASFSFEIIELSGQPDELRVTHDGGDAIANDELYLTFQNVQIQDEDGSPGPFDRISWFDVTDDNGASKGDLVTAGDSALLEPPNGDPELEDKTLRVVWDDGDNSATLRVWEGPDA